MTANLLIEATKLSQFVKENPESLIVDVTSSKSYQKHHIKSAIYFDYQHLVSGHSPAPGTLPEINSLSNALSEHGINPDKTIIAYDDEGGTKASRLIWTLDVLGFQNLHIINGGLHSWAKASLPWEDSPNSVVAHEHQQYHYDQSKIATMSYILENIDNPDVIVWDVRTEQEHDGTKPRSARNGHIPGAINLNWMHTIDTSDGLRYLPKQTLIDMLAEKGITKDKIIIPHCHTHQRSAHSSILLKSLGFKNIKAYPGSWSEWGNSSTTPIES